MIKPFAALVAFVLHHYFDLYDQGNFSPRNGYVYICIAVNTFVSFSLYWLVMFYMATKDAMARYDPVLKFLCIKGVLFFSFWQSVVVSVLGWMNIITEVPIIYYTAEHISATIQNGLI